LQHSLCARQWAGVTQPGTGTDLCVRDTSVDTLLCHITVSNEFGALGDHLPGPSPSYSTMRCTRRGAAGWRHYSTTRRMRVFSPIVSLEFFIHLILPAAMALGSTQSLKEMHTRSISWGVKEAGARDWPYYLRAPNVLKSGGLNLLYP